MFEEDHEFHQAKSELNQQKAQEKAWEKLIEERWNQLEFAIQKQGEENFEQYLNGNSEVFNNVKKTYGIKVTKKMKSE